MSVSLIASHTPTKAVLALAVAGLFVGTPVWAQDVAAPVNAKTTKAPKAVVAPKGKKTATPTPTVAVSSGVKLTDIVVQGLQRSDPSTVFGFLPVKVGDNFSADRAQEVIKALYASGLYEDVSVGLEGSVLQVKLAERAVMSDLTIKGMKQFDKKEIASGLKNYGFAQGYPYNPALLEKVKSEIKAMYTDAGLVNAKITSEVKEADRKQVAVTITVDEGKYQKVRHINLEGNKAVSSFRIRSIMDLNTNGIMSWYSKDSRFAPERLNTDLELIKSYYYDHGYMDFDFSKVETPASAKGDGVDVSLGLNEGVQYRVSSIKLDGDTKGTPRADVEKLVKYKAGRVYSRTEMSAIASAVSRRLSNDGYALAKVNVVPTTHKDTRTVDVAITVDPAERVYVRHINITGNSRTKDNVIRREVRQMESSIYNAENVQGSRDRIDRLGYFSEATVETIPVAGTNNQVDVNYVVKEVPTGTMKLGLGYSTSDKVSLTGSISENNFMGSGNSLGLDVDTSKSTRNLTVTTRNPYVTNYGMSRDLSVYYRKYDGTKLSTANAKYTTLGLNLNYGVPISEHHKVFLGINPEHNNIVLVDGTSPASYSAYTKGHGTSFTTYALTAGWSYDTRNSGTAPTSGMYQRLNLEVAPFGDIQYYKGTYQLQKFVPLSKYFTLALNTQFDYGAGYGKSKNAFPFFKNLYAGGIGSVRGYDTSTIGPTDNKDNRLGGSKRFVTNLEFQFPFPGLTKSKDVRMFVFADAGGLWADSNPVDISGVPTGKDATCDYSKITVSGCNGLRYSYGLGLTWNSPIGPLKFSYGLPINKKASDKAQRFQFQMGTSF